MKSERKDVELDQSIQKASLLSSNNLSPQKNELINRQSSSDGLELKTPFLSATLAMMAAALGTGIFNLPLRITQIGVAIFLLYVFIAGLFSYFGCLLLQRMIAKGGFESYQEISEAAFGPVLKRLSQFCLVFFPWGIAICYQVIIPKFIIQLLADVFNVDLYTNRANQQYNTNGNHLRLIINMVLISTNFFLIRLKNLRIIQRIVTIGVLSITYSAVTIFILLFVGFTHHGTPKIHYNNIFYLDWSTVDWVVFGKKAFSLHSQALTSILFCYINHQLVFPTCKNIDKPSRLNACFFISVFSQCTLYIISALSGYLLLLPNKDVLPIGPMVLTLINAWPMILGKLFMVISLYFALPLFFFPARTILSESLGLQKTARNHEILSIVLAVSTCAIAMTFLQINSYFGFLGGTAGVLIGGGIPALCYWKLIIKGKQNRNCSDLVIVIFFLVITIIAFIGAILSVVQPPA